MFSFTVWRSLLLNMRARKVSTLAVMQTFLKNHKLVEIPHLDQGCLTLGGWGQLLWNMLTSWEFGLRCSAPRHRLLWHMPANSLFGRCTVHFCNGCQELLCNALYTGSSPSCINPTDNALLHHSHVLTVHFTFLQHWCVPWASSNNNAHSQWFTLDIVCPMPPHPWEHKSTATTMVWTIG